MSDAHFCEACSGPALNQAYPLGATPTSLSGEVRVELERLIISEIHDHQVVIFREVEGERRLPFALGIFEATAVDYTLKGLTFPRPLTHDSWLATVEALGAKMQAACIHDVREQIYFAELRLDRGGELIRIDVRPSDALTLALKAGAPILIADRLLGPATGAIQ